MFPHSVEQAQILRLCELLLLRAIDRMLKLMLTSISPEYATDSTDEIQTIHVQQPLVFEAQLKLLTISLLSAAHVRQESVDLLVGHIRRIPADALRHLLPCRLVGLPGLLIQHALRLIVMLRLAPPRAAGFTSTPRPIKCSSTLFTSCCFCSSFRLTPAVS